jgi:hypothetical protein
VVARGCGVAGGLRQNHPVATQVSFRLDSSRREWLPIRRSGDNPLGASGGPLPQITIPLEARITDRGISVEILRLGFNLKIGNTLVGQGEIGPYTFLGTDMALLLTGVDDPDRRAHAENESVHSGELQKCCVNEALLLGYLADGIS